MTKVELNPNTDFSSKCNPTNFELENAAALEC